jgi:SET domain
VASQRIDKGRLIFVERPLVALQSLGNPAWVCHACKAFVGGPHAALSIIANRMYPELTSTDSNANEEDGDGDGDDHSGSWKVVPCRHACGQVYCSKECEQDFWEARHQYLCTGLIGEECESTTAGMEQHPLIQFKQHAVTTNEIFLLVAEWMVAEYAHVQEQKKHKEAPYPWIQPSDTFLSAANHNNNPFDDFLMEPWWDVEEVSHDDHDDDAEATKDILKKLCQEASRCWQQHWEMLLPAKNNTHPDAALDVNQSPLHMAKIIGACELNSIGIRRRNPLCRDIFSRELRLQRKRELLACLEQAGMLEQPTNTSNSEDHDGAQGTYHATGTEKDDNMVGGKGEDEGYSDDAVAGFLAGLDIFEEETIIKRQSNEATVKDRGTEAIDGGDMFHSTSTEDDGEDDDDDDDGHQHGNQDHDDLDTIFNPLDGTAMYALCCKMNHSCDPNVVVLYKTGGWGPLHPLVAHAVALRDIQEGEELCISYIDSGAPLEKRQEAVAHYGFTCGCVKCEKEKAAAGRCDSSRPTEVDSMVDDADPSGDGFLFGSDDSEDDGEGNKSFDAETNNQEPDLAHGEDSLALQLNRLDKVLNHSSMGTISLQDMAQASTFVIQTAKGAGEDLQGGHLGADLDGLLRQNVFAVRERDYVLAKAVGAELERTLFSVLKKECNWPCLAYRKAYWCAAVCAAVGFAHIGSFLPAMRYLDRAIILGLNRDSVNEFFSYVEYHASQIAIGPCLPSLNRSYIQDYGSPKFEACLSEKSLSKPIAFAVDEQAIADERSTLSCISKGKAVVIRQYASAWPAVHKWR